MKIQAVLAASLLAVFAATTAPAQATREYNRILTEMEQDYQAAGRIRGRAERKQAYIDHGKRFSQVLSDFLAKHPDCKMAFAAKLNLAQVLQMAKERERAKAVIDEAVPLASNHVEIRRLADTASVVYTSKKKGWEIISSSLSKVDAEPLRAQLHLELIKYIERPEGITKKMRSEWVAYRKKKMVEVCEAVAKGYPNTDAAMLAAAMIEGSKAAPGQPAANLKFLLDVDEKPLDLDAYKGKVVLLHFFTVSNRGYRKSKNYLTKLVKLGRELDDKGLVILGICANYREHKELLDRMIGDARIGWRIYHDGEKLWNKACMVYFVKKFPKNIIIGRDGKILSTDEAVIDLEDVLPEVVAGS